jgi:hypothetical protein
MLKIAPLFLRSRRILFACLLIVTSSCNGSDGVSPDAGTAPLDAGGVAPVYHPAVKLLVFSDPHYFDPSLGTTGSAFESYLASDRKLIAESDAIMRAMVGQVEAVNPQVVLVSGDLTKDGEALSHASAAAYLAAMKSGGRKVFVVPGNHDIQNAAASSYAGDTATPVATISAGEFADIYKNFGFSDAIARDTNSLSYVAELVPGLWLLALDSCTYGETRGSSATGGRILDGTKVWIQAQLDLAKQQGVRVIAMMHHGLVEHFTNQALLFSEFLVSDRAAIGSLLSERRRRRGLYGPFSRQRHHPRNPERFKQVDLRRRNRLDRDLPVRVPSRRSERRHAGHHHPARHQHRLRLGQRTRFSDLRL